MKKNSLFRNIKQIKVIQEFIYLNAEVSWWIWTKIKRIAMRKTTIGKLVYGKIMG